MTKSCRKKTKTMNYPDNQICTYSICKDVYFLFVFRLRKARLSYSTWCFKIQFKGYPGVYTKISTVVSWIRLEMMRLAWGHQAIRDVELYIQILFRQITSKWIIFRENWSCYIHCFKTLIELNRLSTVNKTKNYKSFQLK